MECVEYNIQVGMRCALAGRLAPLDIGFFLFAPRFYYPSADLGRTMRRHRAVINPCTRIFLVMHIARSTRCASACLGLASSHGLDDVAVNVRAGVSQALSTTPKTMMGMFDVVVVVGYLVGEMRSP